MANRVNYQIPLRQAWAIREKQDIHARMHERLTITVCALHLYLIKNGKQNQMRSPVLNKTHRLTTTHTLLTSSPCGLVKKQFAACSKAGLRVAAASQVTNWQSCFPLPLIVGVGVFSSAVESPCQRPRSVLEREWEGNDGNTIRVFYFCFPPLARFLFSSVLSVVFSPSVFVSFFPSALSQPEGHQPHY